MWEKSLNKKKFYAGSNNKVRVKIMVQNGFPMFADEYNSPQIFADTVRNIFSNKGRDM